MGNLHQNSQVIRVTGADVGNSSKRRIKVDTLKTVYNGFMSFGANMFAGILSEEGKRLTDMNDVFFEIEKKRFMSAKPQFNRYFIYIDYLITNVESRPGRADWQNNRDYINYKNGVYDFQSEQMQAFYKYMDLQKACGSSVYVNFGFKQAQRLLKWFGMNEYRNDPAPKDNGLFVNACMALLKELLYRGYNNIIGVSFYNEPDGQGFSTDGVSTKYERLADITQRMDKMLREEGLRDKIMVFGPEMANVRPDNSSYLDYMEKNIPECLDGYTVHSYYWTKAERGAGVTRPVDYDMMSELGHYIRDNYSHPPYLTEFNTGNYDWNEKVTGKSAFYSEGSEWTWKTSNASLFIACANSGYLGACRWSYSGQYWSDPLRYGSFKDNYHSLWLGAINLDAIQNGVMDKYYSDSLFTNYVKAGSEVLFVDWEGEDIRVAAFRLPDGNYTVIVETNENDKDREIEITFDKSIGKSFYKMHTSHEIENTGNATVPVCEKAFRNVENVLCDKVDNKYACYVYTTCTPIKQIELNTVTATVKRGEKFTFKASMVDCDSCDDVVWSISSNVGGRPGIVEQNGTYTADNSAMPGDLTAVRVTLKSDPAVYNVAVIQII